MVLGVAFIVGVIVDYVHKVDRPTPLAYGSASPIEAPLAYGGMTHTFCTNCGTKAGRESTQSPRRADASLLPSLTSSLAKSPVEWGECLG